jgi:protein-disulfide isomerase
MKIKNMLLLPVSANRIYIVTAIAVVISIWVLFTQSSSFQLWMLTPDTSKVDDSSTLIKASSVSVDDGISKGKPDAPISIIEFGDFQCPYCQSFATDTEPQIQTTYIDTGKVKFIFMEYPMQDVHTNAMAAALAAECANEQGKFWRYHDILYSQQSHWENLDTNEALKILTSFAANAALNVQTFNSCLYSMKYENKINKQIEEGKSNQIDATPTLYVGNDKIGYTELSGTYPFAVFQRIIDQQLYPLKN